MEENEEYAYSKNGKEIDISLLKIYRKLHKKGYPKFALWSKPFVEEKSSFIIITKDNIYLNAKNIIITQKHHEIINNYNDRQEIIMYQIKDVKVTDQIILIDYFDEEYKLNFNSTIPKEIMSYLSKMIIKASFYALDAWREDKGFGWCTKVKTDFENGEISSREYNSFVKLMGPQWTGADGNNSSFISEVFGLFLFDNFDTRQTINVQKNMLKNAPRISIVFHKINRKKYGAESYEKMMNKCMTLLDKYDEIKKKAIAEIIKRYQGKEKLFFIIQGKLTNTKVNINDIIKHNEPNIKFSVENEEIMMELDFRLSISHLKNLSGKKLSKDSVSIKFNEKLNVAHIR